MSARKYDGPMHLHPEVAAALYRRRNRGLRRFGMSLSFLFIAGMVMYWALPTFAGGMIAMFASWWFDNFMRD